MTLEQQEALARELDGAMQSGDSNRIQCALANILLALIDCQRKTADRVKELIAYRETLRAHFATVNWIGRAIWGLASAGGFAALVKLMKVAGVL